MRPALQGVEMMSKEERAEFYNKKSGVESEWKKICRMMNKVLVHRDRWKAPGLDGEEYRRKAGKDGRMFVLEVPDAVLSRAPVGPDDEPPDWNVRLANFNESETKLIRAVEIWEPHRFTAKLKTEPSMEFFEARRQIQLLWDPDFPLTAEQIRRQKYGALFAFNAANRRAAELVQNATTVEDALGGALPGGDGKGKGGGIPPNAAKGKDGKGKGGGVPRKIPKAIPKARGEVFLPGCQRERRRGRKTEGRKDSKGAPPPR
jgi:hypothetical protein